MSRRRIVIEKSLRGKIVELFPDNRARQEFAFEFIATIYRCADEQGLPVTAFVKTPCYEFKTGARHFKPVRSVLIAKRVLWEDKSYLVKAKLYKRLAIDDQYVRGDLVVEVLEDDSKKSAPIAKVRGRLASHQRKVMKGLSLSIPDVALLKREDLLDPDKMPKKMTEFPTKLKYYDGKSVEGKWVAGTWAKENNVKWFQFFRAGDKAYSVPVGQYDKWVERWLATKETSIKNKLMKIESGDFRCRRNSDTTHRLYGTITGLPRTARRFVLLDDEPLVEIDMKNAQFALLAWAVDKLGQKAGRVYLPAHFREVCNSVRKTLDYQIFRKVANDGRFYEYIMEKFGILERDEAKDLTFPFVFGYPEEIGRSVHRLDHLFPSIWAIRCKWHEKEEIPDEDPKTAQSKGGNGDKALLTVAINATKGKGGKNKKERKKAPKGKHFACLLQKLEAYLMLEKVYAELIRHEYRTLTLHDCILAKESDAQAVQKISQETLRRNGFDGQFCIKESKAVQFLAS